jgi:riboflavin synthase
VFTGIIETLGTVRKMAEGVLDLEVDLSAWPDAVAVGESIAVDGCCLTLVSSSPLGPRGQSGSLLRFDLSPETLARTSLGTVLPGSLVNLERAMRADGRFGGHIVQGHVDATGTIAAITPSENSTVIRFRVPSGAERYLIDKGSITVDGISLTVVNPEGTEFDTWIIPHTLANTNLRERRPGDAVNLEFDALARYVERLLAFKA